MIDVLIPVYYALISYTPYASECLALSVKSFRKISTMFKQGTILSYSFARNIRMLKCLFLSTSCCPGNNDTCGLTTCNNHSQMSRPQSLRILIRIAKEYHSVKT